MTVELREFLTARLAEDQRLAERAASLCGCHRPALSWLFDDRDERDATSGRILVVDDPHPVPRRKISRRWSTSYDGLYMAEHIVRHDPARVLREVEAKRRILAAYVDDDRVRFGAFESCSDSCPVQVLDEVVKLLAAPYSDHPDYRQEWTP